MHQFRDRSGAQRELDPAGLLVYPVLQAADVLAYRAHEVPVGEDQREHLELMRDVARRFNARFGDGEQVLVVPEHRIPEVGARIMDLQDPTRKMSTTGASARHRARARRAPGDRKEDPQRRHRLRQRDSPRARQARRLQPDRNPRGRPCHDARAVEAEMAGARGYGDLKAAVAEAVVAYLAPVRERYRDLRADAAVLEGVLEAGAARARAIAADTLTDVRAHMGVGPPAPSPGGTDAGASAPRARAGADGSTSARTGTVSGT